MNNYIPSVSGMEERSRMGYIPAHGDGPFGRREVTYIPVLNNQLKNMYSRNIRYIPCSSSASDDPWGCTEDTIKKFNLGWWEEGKSFFLYPFMLVSAYYGMKYPNFRGHFNIPKDNFILYGDSGGFQNLSSNRGLYWRNVLNWQEKNCDVIFSLDYPPLPTKDSKLEREKKYNKSIENIRLMVENKNFSEKKYYGCVHAVNLRELEEYGKKIKDYDLDGYSHGQLAIKESSVIDKIDRIVASYFLSDKSQHFLGLSTPIAIAVGYFIEKLTGQKFTYDNSSYGRGAMVRKYFVNEQASIILNKNSKINYLGCDCPICSRLQNIDDMKSEGSVPGALISLHNLYMEIKKDIWLKSLIDSPEELFQYLRLSSKPNNIKKRIEYLFKYEDIEKYVKNFPYKITNMNSIQMRLV